MKAQRPSRAGCVWGTLYRVRGREGRSLGRACRNGLDHALGLVLKTMRVTEGSKSRRETCSDLHQELLCFQGGGGIEDG